MADEKKLSDIEKEQEDSKSEDSPEVKETEPKEKKNKFGFKVPKLGKKKDEIEGEETSKEKEVPVRSKPISPSELVNDLDKDIRILDESKDASMSKIMDEQIEEVKDNDVTISITKKGFILGMGLVLMILWIIPLSQYAMEKIPTLLEKNAEAEDIPVETEDFEEISESTDSAKMIRIKDASGGSEEVKRLATILEDGGYEYVEILADESFTETEITVITKADLASQYASVSALVEDEYQIVDSVATLEGDSEFGIVILFP